jgi:DNA polymerase epsilon subunit 2
VAKSWKKVGGQVIVDGDGDILKVILKAIEGSMSGGRVIQSNHSALSRQGSLSFGPDANVEDTGMTRPPLGESQSFGMSRLEVDDPQEEEESYKDARDWIQVVGAFEQPRLVYNVNKKHFEK